MRIFIILIVTIFGLVSCTKTPELHAIGIYEGSRYPNTDYRDCLNRCENDRDCHSKCLDPFLVPFKTHKTVSVQVDRPRKDVNLILGGGTGAMEWKITVSRKTQINQIVLIGYNAKVASVELNGEPYPFTVPKNNIDVPYQTDGIRFRALVNKLPKSLGFETLSSFQGSYTAPETGFTISDIQSDNHVLDPDYLRYKLQPIDKSLDLRLISKIDGKSGEFLPDGTHVKDCKLTPAFNTAVSADGQSGYIYKSSRIQRISAWAPFGGEENIPKPNPKLDLGHFRAMALDESRNRILAIFQAGSLESTIMALDLRTHVWSKFGSTGQNQPSSLFYDAANDRFLVLVRNWGLRREIVEIGTFDAESGEYNAIRDVDMKGFYGLTDLYDVGNMSAPDLYIVGIKEENIALATTGMGVLSGFYGKDNSLRRIYTMGLKSGKPELTYYNDDGLVFKRP